MPPFDTPDIPHDLRLQWIQLTDYGLAELRSLYNEYNQIRIPILDMRSFCQLAIAEGRVAKSKDDLHLRAKNRVDEQLKELYSLMNHIYCDSYDSSKTSLSDDASTYVRGACVSSNLQTMIEAICKKVYRREEEESPDLLPKVEEDDDDDEDDYRPETQYLPMEYGLLDDCSESGFVNFEDHCRVEELGDITAPAFPSRTCEQKTPTTSPTSPIITGKLPSDASRITCAETSSSHNSLPDPNLSKERLSYECGSHGEAAVHGEPGDNDAPEALQEAPSNETMVDSSNAKKGPEAPSSPDFSSSQQRSNGTPEPALPPENCDKNSPKCDVSPHMAAGRIGHPQDSPLLNGKRKRPGEDEDGNTSCKRNCSK